MKLFVAVFFALLVAGASSAILDNQQRQVFRLIRNICMAESGLSSLEIGNIFKALRPVRKLAAVTNCTVNRILELQNVDETVGEIVSNGEAALASINLTTVANRLSSACNNLLGSNSCSMIFRLLGNVLNIIDVQQNLLPQS